jgi:hypothetical protein
MTLLDEDNLEKIEKVFVHELTHLVQDLLGTLVVPKKDVVDNYFKNVSENEALVNEILFFKFYGFTDDQIKDIFSESLVRFNLDQGSEYYQKLDQLIEEASLER